MAIIEMAMDETVAVIKMNNGENRHHLEFARAMHGMLETAIQDEAVTAIILTSTDEKNWSQGIDLEWMMGLMGENDTATVIEFMFAMDKVFRTLLTCPVPVIAAINGHCFANGAIMAAACDFRFMRSDRGYYCLPEVDINIQFAPAMTALFFHKYSKPVVNRLLLTGKRMTAPELEENNIIEKACSDTAETMEQAMTFAKMMQKRRDTYGKMKLQMNQTVIDVIDNVNPDYFKNQKVI
jgi:enoyl-CoA hydratase/carnithine racemase